MKWFMKWFSFFRSLASNSMNSNPTSTAPLSSSKGRSFSEAPSQNDGKNPMGEKIHDGSQILLKDSALKPANLDPERAISSSWHHRRSLSFSSESHGENINHSNNLSGSPSSGGSSHCNPQTRKCCTRPKRGGQAQHPHAVVELDSPFSSRDHQRSSEYSLHNSPIPLSCMTTRLTPILDKNKNLDLYVDEKLQCEEHRLWERVRDLAEQNVSLQREIFSIKGLEVDTRSRILNLEASLEKARTENHDLYQSLSELQVQLKGAEEERECIRRSYREKERENKELQKVVAWLQRVCSEQDKTINGLRQGFHEEIREQPIERSDPVSRLQMEQLRLTGVEWNLRKEVESLRHEVESLRHENTGLLNRLQATGNGSSFSAIKLEQELCAQVDFLQDKGLSLLHDFDHFYGDLLGFISRKKCDHDQETSNEFDGRLFADYTMKHESLHRGHENFRRSLQTTAQILVKKSSSQALDCQSETTECGRSKHSEDELEHELKVETLLKRVLQEKLFSKEMELDQLRADLASSIRVHDVLQTEIQRLQDELSCLTHKMKDVDLQMLKKDESIKQLQHDLQEGTKELIATGNIVLKIAEERDHMWEEVKDSRETIMLLNHEGFSLKKKIEELEEEVLTKEGQNTILKDWLHEKPRTLEEFFLGRE